MPFDKKVEIGEFCYGLRLKGLKHREIIEAVQKKFDVFTDEAMQEGVGRGRYYYNIVQNVGLWIKAYRLCNSFIKKLD